MGTTVLAVTSMRQARSDPRPSSPRQTEGPRRRGPSLICFTSPVQPVTTDPKTAPIVAAAATAGVEIQPVRFDSPTRTAQEAADAVGCDVGQIVKSLVFATPGGHVLLLVSGANRVDTSAARRLGTGELTRADADAVKQVTGYSIGSTPPFGHPQRIDVFMDEDLLSYEQVWAAGGRPDTVFAIAPRDLARISGAVLGRLAG